MRKSAHYRRAYWFREDPQALQHVLEAALDNAEEGVRPFFDISEDTECVVARQIEVDGRLFLSLIAYEEGAGAAVIAAAADEAEIDPDEAEAPDGMEFVQAHLLCLVSGDNVLWTTHGSPLREGTVRLYLQKLLEKYSDNDQDVNFQLRAELDVEQLRAAFEEGIEEIDLNAGAFRNTIEEAFDLGAAERGGFLSHIFSLIQEIPNAEEMEAASDVTMRVSLKPGKDWKKENVKHFLADLGQDIYAEEDGFEGFAIVTKSGLRLTHDKLTVHRAFNVEGNRRVINAIQVKDRLNAILNDLLEVNVVAIG